METNSNAENLTNSTTLGQQSHQSTRIRIARFKCSRIFKYPPPEGTGKARMCVGNLAKLEWASGSSGKGRMGDWKPYKSHLDAFQNSFCEFRFVIIDRWLKIYRRRSGSRPFKGAPFTCVWENQRSHAPCKSSERVVPDGWGQSLCGF
jgi:hypothetical protein